MKTDRMMRDITLDDLVSIAMCLGNWKRKFVPDKGFDATYSAEIDEEISLHFSVSEHKHIPNYYSISIGQTDHIAYDQFREFHSLGGADYAILYRGLKEMNLRGYWEGGKEITLSPALLHDRFLDGASS